MKKLGLAHKRLLVVCLPLLALLFFSGRYVYERYRVEQEMSQAQAALAVVREAAQLAHELQKERGMSAGFLGSGGNKFRDALPTQRKQVDTLLQRFREDPALLALKEVQQRAQLAAQIAAKIRTLEGADQVPPEFLTFATETWAEVVALAHLRATEAELRDGDPGGYLALIGSFFWSVQPAQVGADVAQLHAVQPLLQEKIRAGLELLGRSNEHIDAFLAQLQACHDALERTVQTSLAPAPTLAHELQAAGDVPPLSTLMEAPQKTFEASASEMVGSTLNSELDAQVAPAPSSAPAPVDVDFRVGVWVELVQQRRSVRTQLTWVSPQHTLFLFTAKDGSTQSMTLRMRDKLLAEGNLRIVAPPSRRASTQ